MKKYLCCIGMLFILTANSQNTYTIGTGTQLVASNGLQLVFSSGNLTNNGSLTDATGTVTFKGAITYSGTGSILFNNLVIDHSSSTSLLNDTLNIAGTLTPTAGTLNANGKLVLKSTATATARVAPGPGSITGNLTQERYIPAKPAKTWTMLASPFSQLISNSWQQQVHITGAGSGGTSCPTLTPHSNGFDATLANSPSMYIYDGTKPINSRWTSIIGTNNTSLSAGTGYRMNIRGPRTLGCSLLDGTVSTVAAATVRSSGSLSAANKNAGSFTISYPNNGNATPANDNYLLIGNPYPSEISFFQLRTDNSSKINNTYAVFAPGNATGNYAYWNGATWTGGTIGLSDATGNIIANGQAFFVQGSVAGADISNLAFNESQKTTSTNNGYFRTQLTPNRLRIGLLLNNGERVDETMLFFNSNANTDKLNTDDIVSMSNGQQNLQSLKAGKALAFNTRPLDFVHDTVALRINSSSNGRFQFSFYDFEEFIQHTDARIYLLDNYKHMVQLMNDNKEYGFEVNIQEPETQGSNRFAVVFEKQVLVQANRPIIKAYPNPFMDQLMVSFPNASMYTIRLLDIQGRELKKLQAQSQATISTNHLSTGNYLLEAINAKGEKSTQKVTKQ